MYNLDKPDALWKQVLWIDEVRKELYWRKKVAAFDKKNRGAKTSSYKHTVMFELNPAGILIYI